jgi:hypothetical protein
MWSASLYHSILDDHKPAIQINLEHLTYGRVCPVDRMKLRSRVLTKANLEYKRPALSALALTILREKLREPLRSPVACSRYHS